MRRHCKRQSPHNAETIGTVASGWVTTVASAVIMDTGAGYVIDGAVVAYTTTGACATQVTGQRRTRPREQVPRG